MFLGQGPPLYDRTLEKRGLHSTSVSAFGPRILYDIFHISLVKTTNLDIFFSHIRPALYRVWWIRPQRRVGRGKGRGRNEAKGRPIQQGEAISIWFPPLEAGGPSSRSNLSPSRGGAKKRGESKRFFYSLPFFFIGSSSTACVPHFQKERKDGLRAEWRNVTNTRKS